MKIKENKGITLVTLVITVIVLAIIAGITVYSGIDTVKRANLESLRTNMLLIQAKAKEYVEEASFKIGPDNNDIEKANETAKNVYEGYGLKKINDANSINNIVTDLEKCYEVNSEALNNMGLGKIAEGMEADEKYIVKFNEEELTVEVYNTIGYQGHYSLTKLEELQ